MQIIPKDVVEGILKIIKDEGGQIALSYALQVACQQSEKVKEFLKNEKLTQRGSRKVKKIFVTIIRDSNIQIKKRKPQLVVKWVEKEEMTQN